MFSDIDNNPKMELTKSISQEIASSQNYFVDTNMPSTTQFSNFIIPAYCDNSIFKNDNEVYNQISRKDLIESITQPSRNSLIKTKIEELLSIYSTIGFQNEAIIEIATDVIRDCLNQDKKDIKISRTGENELLIYREIDGVFNNIIIDEDADIEFLHIPINRADTYNEYYPFIENIDTYNLASKL